jgi:hypothetical protein
MLGGEGRASKGLPCGQSHGGRSLVSLQVLVACVGLASRALHAQNCAGIFDGTYTGVAELGDGYTHTETDIVSEIPASTPLVAVGTTIANVSGIHTFTNGSVSGSFIWTGTITLTGPTSGVITGQGIIDNAGVRPFTLTAGGVSLDADGNANLYWGGVDPVFGGIGWTTQRPASPEPPGCNLQITPLFAGLSATAGLAYASAPFVASGGTAPYTWSASPLPGGLQLVSAGNEAMIQGSALAPSTEYSIDVEGEYFSVSGQVGSVIVTDQTGAQKNSLFTLNVQFNPYVPLPPQTKTEALNASIAKATEGLAIILGVIACESIPACAPEGTVEVPAIEGIVGQLGTSAVGDLLQGLDPPDSNFTVIATPEQISPPTIQANSQISPGLATALNSWLANGYSEISLQLALVTSLNRACGAVVANNTTWWLDQLRAAKRYSRRLSALLAMEGPLRLAVASALAGTNLDIALDPSSINQAISQVAQVGFTSAETSILEAAGITQDQLPLIQNMIANSNITFTAVDLAGAFLDRDTLAALTQEANSYAAFWGPLTPRQISTIVSGLAYSRVSETFNGTVTIANTSSAAINGPLQIVLTSLTTGVTLANATGSFAGNRYITVPLSGSLGPGQSTTVAVQFKNPANAAINFTPVIYSGSLCADVQHCSRF